MSGYTEVLLVAVFNAIVLVGKAYCRRLVVLVVEDDMADDIVLMRVRYDHAGSECILPHVRDYSAVISSS